MERERGRLRYVRITSMFPACVDDAHRGAQSYSKNCNAGYEL